MLTKTFKILLCFSALTFFVVGCERADKFKYVDARVDDIVGKKFEAIIVRSIAGDPNRPMALIGTPERVQEIARHEIKPAMIIDSSWIEPIVSDFINAKRVKHGYWDDGRVIFLTKNTGYTIKLGEDASKKLLYGPDYESEQLWKDFIEIGILEKRDPNEKPFRFQDYIQNLKPSKSLN